jgi:serine protease Do
VDEKNLPHLSLGDSDKCEVGEWVLAVGNPFSESLRHSVTAGIISAKGRDSIGSGGFQNFIQTDAAINPGNSGGALVNMRGEVIGINTAIISRSGGNAGIGLAVPSNLARRIMDSLKTDGKVIRGYLGVYHRDLDNNLARAFGLERPTGALVNQVVDGSPADKAGLKRGDIILQVDGREITSGQDLVNTIGLTPAGQEVTLKILREGKELNAEVTLAEREEDTILASTEPEKAESDVMKSCGFKAVSVTQQARELYGTSEGVLIAEVTPGSAADEAGLVRGVLITEVDRAKVATIQEFTAMISKAQPGSVVLLYGMVSDGRGTTAGRYFSLEIPQE